MSTISAIGSVSSMWSAWNHVAASVKVAPTPAKRPVGKAALLSTTAASSTTASPIYYSSSIVVFDAATGQYVIEYRNQLTGQETSQTPLHAAEEYQHTQQVVGGYHAWHAAASVI